MEKGEKKMHSNSEGEKKRAESWAIWWSHLLSKMRVKSTGLNQKPETHSHFCPFIHALCPHHLVLLILPLKCRSYLNKATSFYLPCHHYSPSHKSPESEPLWKLSSYCVHIPINPQSILHTCARKRFQKWKWTPASPWLCEYNKNPLLYQTCLSLYGSALLSSLTTCHSLALSLVQSCWPSFQVSD